MSVSAVVIEVNDANIRNSHFYLRRAEHLLSRSVIGGSNRAQAAEERLIVEFQPGRTVETDVAGDKMILRNRAAVRDFFDRAAVSGGDRILVEVVGRNRLRVTKAP